MSSRHFRVSFLDTAWKIFPPKAAPIRPTFAPDVATGSATHRHANERSTCNHSFTPNFHAFGVAHALAEVARAFAALPYGTARVCPGTGSDPWDNAVNVLKTAFTGTIATGLSLVAIVVGGLMFAYGEGQSKKTLAGIVFGVGMAIGAVNFMAWLFPS